MGGSVEYKCVLYYSESWPVESADSGKRGFKEYKAEFTLPFLPYVGLRLHFGGPEDDCDILPLTVCMVIWDVNGHHFCLWVEDFDSQYPQDSENPDPETLEYMAEMGFK